MESLPNIASRETWLFVARVAAVLGISENAVQKNARRGKYVTRYVPGRRGGTSGKVLQIALSSLPAPVQRTSHAAPPGETRRARWSLPRTISLGIFARAAVWREMMPVQWVGSPISACSSRRITSRPASAQRRAVRSPEGPPPTIARSCMRP